MRLPMTEIAGVLTCILFGYSLVFVACVYERYHNTQTSLDLAIYHTMQEVEVTFGFE